jgi:hypothetical protein
METEGLLPCSQKPATNSHLEPDESSPRPGRYEILVGIAQRKPIQWREKQRERETERERERE